MFSGPLLAAELPRPREQAEWRPSPTCFLRHQPQIISSFLRFIYSLQHVPWVSGQVATRMMCSSPRRSFFQAAKGDGTNLEMIAKHRSYEKLMVKQEFCKPVEVFTQQNRQRLQIRISPPPDSCPQSWFMRTPLSHNGLYAFWNIVSIYLLWKSIWADETAIQLVDRKQGQSVTKKKYSFHTASTAL